ncbi:Iron sulfur assembly protein 1 [Paramyrothecium foliicola]|nr:Iron sulfur assembly protein 1 [Paramyrothecium foliicola]
MSVSRYVAAAALRHSRTIAFRQPSVSAAAFYHAYSLPSSTSSTAPRNSDVPETSITQPEPLPKVHETRPPQGGATSPPPAPPSSVSSPPSASTSTTTTAAPPAANAAPATSTSTSAAAKPKRARPQLRARKAAMKLTPSAVEQLRALLDRPDPKLIKVGVRNRGCSGLAYHLEYVDKPGAFDEMVEQDGVKVLVDSKALFSIIGSEMDWREDKLNQRFKSPGPLDIITEMAVVTKRKSTGKAASSAEDLQTAKTTRTTKTLQAVKPTPRHKPNADMSPQLALIAAAATRTPFERRVWAALCQIPAGSVSTYGLLSAHLGSSPRAVGNALRRNPFAPGVPCHRVVATDGTLGGFKGKIGWRDGEGTTLVEKRRLLREEGVRFDDKGKVLGTPWAAFA